MWGKVLASAAVVLAFGLAAFLGQHMIRAFGDARYAAGQADGRVAQLPAILAANAAVTKAALDARDGLIAADAGHVATIARLLPLILSSNDEVTAYAATDAGRAACLDADRVHGIKTSRVALFPAATGTTGAYPTGSMPADTVAHPTGWRAE